MNFSLVENTVSPKAFLLQMLAFSEGARPIVWGFLPMLAFSEGARPIVWGFLQMLALSEGVLIFAEFAT